jgi:hypothetical protein
LNSIQALSGWSRCPVPDESGKPLFEQCAVSLSCLGAKNPSLKGMFSEQSNSSDLAETSYSESCNEAAGFSNETTRCSTCKSGYASDASGRCVQCGDGGGSTALTILFFIAVTLLFVLMIALKMRSSGSKKAAHSTLKRTFLTHLQMVSIVMSLNVPWPSAVRSLLVGVSSVMSISSQSSSVQCMNGASVAEIFYGTLILAVVLPLIMAGISWMYWFACVPRLPVLGCSKNLRVADARIKQNPFASPSNSNENDEEERNRASASGGGGLGGGDVNWKSTRDGFIITNVYFVYLIFPSIIRMSFETLGCETLCDGALHVLAIDESEVCHSPRHQTIAFVVAVPTLILYLLLLPMLALLYLRAHRHEMQTSRKLILRFGLIFSGYASHRWYWEIFVILRKVVLILIVTFGRTSQSQIHFALGSLGVMLYLQERGKPYHKNQNENETFIVLGVAAKQILNKKRAQNHQLHLTEVSSLGVLCTMCWVAVFFSLTGSGTDNVDVVLSFLVIVSNVAFVSMCGYLACQKFGEKNRLRSKLRKLACCFRQREIIEQDSTEAAQQAATGVEMVLSNFEREDEYWNGDGETKVVKINPLNVRRESTGRQRREI